MLIVILYLYIPKHFDNESRELRSDGSLVGLLTRHIFFDPNLAIC